MGATRYEPDDWDGESGWSFESAATIEKTIEKLVAGLVSQEVASPTGLDGLYISIAGWLAAAA